MTMPRGFVFRWALTAFFGLTTLILWAWRPPGASRGSWAAYDSTASPKRHYETLSKQQQPLSTALREDDALVENVKVPSFPAFKATSDAVEPEIYHPYPRQNSRPWHRQWTGTYASCLGPRGKRLDADEADMLKAYKLGGTQKQPPSMFGSYEELGLEQGICFDRWSRLNPAGFDDDNIDLTRDVDKPVEPRNDWENVDWKGLQDQCFTDNMNRYELGDRENRTLFWLPSRSDLEDVDNALYFPPPPVNHWLNRAKYALRAGLVMHIGAGKEWTLDTTQYLRSLIIELSLHSGAEYELIILVESILSGREIWSNKTAYQDELKNSAPAEFRNLTLLYNDALLEAWYPGTTLHDFVPQQSQTYHQSLQLLSLLRPDLSQFWLLSRYARYTGSMYSLTNTLNAWSTAQPRQYLWERNSHHYIPFLQHTYANFTSHIANMTANAGIWLPPSIPGINPLVLPPPQTPSNIDYGTHEPADLISLSPILNGTLSTNPNNLLNFSTPSLLKQLTSSSLLGLSKRQVRAQHHVQITSGWGMSGENLAPIVALAHGLKAVSVPMPIWYDVAITASRVKKELEGDVTTTADAGDKILRVTSMSPRLSLGIPGLRGKDGEFADELYKRWVGYGKDPAEKLCLPPMLLHPVRGV